MYPPCVHKKFKGSITISFISSLLILAILSVSLTIVAQATLNTNNSSKIALQAQQYAEAEATLIRTTKYNELTAHERVSIDNSIYEKSIEISDEAENEDNVKQKVVSISIYRLDEEIPRYTLKVPRLEVEKTSDVPIGTIIVWASNTDPADGVWLECNGQSCSMYPQLVSVLGKNTVPDYRGVFLRGLGSQVSINGKYGTTTHSSLPLGIIQNDSIRNITGGFATGAWGNVQYQEGPFYPGTGRYHTTTGNGGGSSPIFFDVSRVVPTANENRPINIAVRYLIKAA